MNEKAFIVVPFLCLVTKYPEPTKPWSIVEKPILKQGGFTNKTPFYSHFHHKKLLEEPILKANNN